MAERIVFFKSLHANMNGDVYIGFSLFFFFLARSETGNEDAGASLSPVPAE